MLISSWRIFEDRADACILCFSLDPARAMPHAHSLFLTLAGPFHGRVQELYSVPKAVQKVT